MLAIEFLDHALEHFADRVAVTDGNLSLTYRQIDERARAIANALLSQGVEVGTHVSILSPNHPFVLACQYGILRAGCVYVPSNYRNSASDTEAQFRAFEVKWLFYHSSMQDYLDSRRDGFAMLHQRIAIDQPSGGNPSLVEWSDRFPEKVELPQRRLDDVIYVGPTGGTSGGGIKGAVHTNLGWENNIANFYAIFPFKKPPVHIVVAPLSHAANIFHWGMVGMGGTNVICPAPDPESILSAIEKYRGSLIFLPPTMIYMLLAHPGIEKYDLSSLEYLVFGAAPMSVEKLKEAIATFGPILCQGFGSTETLIMNTFMHREEVTEAAATPSLHRRLASAGRAAPLSLVSVMDDDGNVLPAGTRGEMVIRSTSVMREYFRDPEKTAAAKAFGWHHTGDVAEIDEDGYVYIVDRKNDMIISGGFNVYPGEVEQVILSHHAIQDCAVVGVPHEKWGEMVLAAVELKTDHELDTEELIQFCKERLGSVKAPKMVEILPEMPRSPVGKTLRRAVRDRYWQKENRQI